MPPIEAQHNLHERENLNETINFEFHGQSKIIESGLDPDQIEKENHLLKKIIPRLNKDYEEDLQISEAIKERIAKKLEIPKESIDVNIRITYGSLLWEGSVILTGMATLGGAISLLDYSSRFISHIINEEILNRVSKYPINLTAPKTHVTIKPTKKRLVYSTIIKIYAIAGLFAAIASFILEYEFFQHITGGIFLAFTISIVFELSKICTIVVYEHLINIGKNINKWWKSVIYIFRLFLVILSLFCSLAVLTASLDKPNNNKLILEEKNILIKEKEEIISNLKQGISLEEKSLKNSILQIKNKYMAPLNQASKGIQVESNNPGISGEVRGPKYKAHQARYDELNRAMVEEIRYVEDQNKLIISKKTKEINDMAIHYNKKIAGIEQKDFSNDFRAYDSLLSSVIKVTNEGFLSLLKATMNHMNFIILFSFIVSILLELSILLSFKALSKYYS